MINRLNTPNNHFETIVAAATPPGLGGVAVIRVSGKKVQHIAQAILNKIPQPRFATYSSFHNEKEVIDEGIALFFPMPHSFTGEDVLELQGHGGPAIVNLLIERIVELGARLARPGEFSERAFLNHKIDLVQAEAIADIIEAQSKEAALGAVRSLRGVFSEKIHDLVTQLTQLRVFVEAAIDFTDEEISFLSSQEIKTQIDNIAKQIKLVCDNANQGALLREGIKVVIAGKPNVGKSSLLNALSQKDVAIVTEIPGTTRDVIEQRIYLDGIPLIILDTAGLRQSDDIVEQEGIRRAQHEITEADLILQLITDVNDIEDFSFLEIKKKMILIKNKIDLTNEPPGIQYRNVVPQVSLSIKHNIGLDLLKWEIKKSIGFTMHSENVFTARRRHVDALKRAYDTLQNASQQHTPDLMAEELRLTQNHLTEITGEFGSDDLLGKIFSSFCIGK